MLKFYIFLKLYFYKFENRQNAYTIFFINIILFINIVFFILLLTTISKLNIIYLFEYEIKAKRRDREKKLNVLSKIITNKINFNIQTNFRLFSILINNLITVYVRLILN